MKKHFLNGLMRMLFLCLSVSLCLCGCASDTAEGSSSVASSTSSKKTPSGSLSEDAASSAAAEGPSSAAASVQSSHAANSVQSSRPSNSVSTSSRAGSSSATASTATVSNAFDGKAGRQLVWSDEFDGSSLNTTNKWMFSQTMGASDRYYTNDSNHVYVSDGCLTLKADKYSADRYALPQGLTTKDRMIYTYGYLEMRAKIPYRRGAWPSFWMQSDQRYGKASYMAEIDIFEVFANARTATSTLHKWVLGTGTKHVQRENYIYDKRSYTFTDNSNLNNEFHTYALEWNPEYMAFFVDGQQYAKFSIEETADFGTNVLPGMQGFHDPCYIIMNNELITPGNYNGSWMSASWKCLDEDLPICYVIDYVRLYQKSGETLKTSF